MIDMNPPMSNLLDFDDVTCFNYNDAWAKIMVNGGTPPMTYQWSNGDITDSIGDLMPATYTVTVTDYYKCTTIDSVSIVQPTMLLASITDSTGVKCFGGSDGSATVSASGGTPGYSYVWSTTPPQTGTTASNLSAIQYFVYVTDTNGCDTSVSVFISQPDQILISITDQDESCPDNCDGSIVANVSGGIKPYSYIWSPPISSTDSVVNNLCVGDYYLTVTDYNNCPLTSGLVQIETGVPIDATFNANPISGYAPVDINFTFSGAEAQEYQWDFGDGNSSTVANPTHTFTDEGEYTIILNVNSGPPHYCTDSYTLIITIDALPFMDIPNAFSPNNDGYNDVFRIETRGLVEFNVMIFNRWGKKIHEWSGIDGFWDGTQNGEDVADGVYFFVIKSLGNDGKEYNQQGSVTLMRGE
jgi:gliding motility-associated-like protein